MSYIVIKIVLQLKFEFNIKIGYNQNNIKCEMKLFMNGELLWKIRGLKMV